MNIGNKKLIFITSAIAFSILVVLLAAPTPVQQAKAIVSCTFTRDLYLGIDGNDVKCLQQYLNDGGNAIIATSGAGSPGNESTYFGSLTQNAVIRWQSANGVSPASGYFGSVSRAKYNELLQASTPAPAPTVSVSVNTTSITLGNSFTLTWSSTNATACAGYNSPSSYSYPANNTSGLTITPTSIGTYTTGMKCTGPGGTSSWATKDVNVSQATYAPTINSFSASPTSITQGQSSTLSWSTSNAYGCRISGGAWSNYYEGPNGPFPTVSPAATTAYTLVCYNTSGTNTSPQSVTVTVSTQPQPPGGLPATPCGTTNNLQKQDFNPVCVGWSYIGLGGSTYGISCTPPTGGSCQGITSAHTVSSTGTGTGSTTLYPTSGVYGTYMFAISGQGTDGSPVFANAAAVIIQPLVGETHKACQNNTCVVVDGAGTDECQAVGAACGAPPEVPLEQQPGFGIPAVDIKVLLTVVCSSPLSATPSTIVVPQTATLSWSCSGAPSCSIDQGIGNVAASGSKDVAPTKTTTYTLTCSSVTYQTTIQVNNPLIKEVKP